MKFSPEKAKRLRQRSGLSQAEAAARAGISPQSVLNLEQGKSKSPWPRTIRKLAEAYRCQVEDFYLNVTNQEVG